MLPLVTIPAYIPHGHCYLWQTRLVGLHIVSDLLIALSYFSIPLALVYFARKRQDLPFKEVFALFGAFIVFCGATHLMAIWTLWHPDYWQSGLLKAATALVSLTTAVVLVPIVPRALALPSPEELAAVNAALAEEIGQHQAEEQQLQEQNRTLAVTLSQLRQAQMVLVQNEKMSSLGQLVAGMIHELNNPISFIYGNLFHMETYVHSLFRLLEAYRGCCSSQNERIVAVAKEIDLEFVVQDLPRLLGSMRTGTSRVREIMSSLRSFSRLDESGLKRADLHKGLDDTLTLLSHRLQLNSHLPEISVVKHYGEIQKVECYPGNLNQVFLNLLTNALDALEAQTLVQAPASLATAGKIEITTRMPNPELIRIEICDSGIGIPIHLRNRIFDPFVTTKPVGCGIGMGLAISYQIVTEQHGGALTCQSEPGKGSTFVIELPVRSPESRRIYTEEADSACTQALGAEVLIGV
ncbi:MAG: HAMP domain-containing histidine kinase [Leptolyngbyaceae cyanobacterium SM1_1_3]|nr:HAMP domain-containing histidine kinase [Leptolyngbyaceae cyanobacterium SM1_1_3]NJM85216.1 HAMP domain-containing histidine kinase [Leptolyngbyaceae cyanobacterium RM2_2_21]NJN02617.1 HAMP domain-containing histidine kinase [Leptolyngbyaceae cyanobacterium RM1_1_2]NJO09974.1 HAMP domain-containing histidine kinase [Leptolyngbyaceae cyanobacterium SL_1_1]